VAFVVNYGVPDPASYFAAPLMAALLVMAPLAAAAVTNRPRSAGLAAAALPLLLAALSIPAALAANRELARVARGIRDAWRAIPYERAIVLWNDDHVHRLALFQALEHDHPQRIVEDPVLVSWPAERAAFRRAAGFDPLQGLDLRTRADLARIAPN